jgi:hypothetical protein
VSELLYLSAEDVAGLLPSVEDQLELVERTLQAMLKGDAQLPPKPAIHPRDDAFIHAMPTYLTGADVAEIKWIGGSAGNRLRGLPYLSGVIILNDPETATPTAIIDAADITAARTAAVTGVCVRRFAPAQWRLDQRRVASAVTGVVADVLARPGETMQAGAPVVSLLPPENIFVRFFVPEPLLAKVHRGDDVAIFCDRCPAQLKAKISFISPLAEYTPPIIYSEASRAKLVYMVEARPPREGAIVLNPGQPVAVRPLFKDGVQ